jgi:hypothetical protein
MRWQRENGMLPDERPLGIDCLDAIAKVDCPPVELTPTEDFFKQVGISKFYKNCFKV